MRRGTTPTHTFTLPFNPPKGCGLRIVYAQGPDHEERIVFERTGDDIEINENVCKCHLTAKETLMFDCSPHWHNGKNEPYPVKIQVGLKTINGDVLWSDIFTTTVERCIRKDGVV